MQVLEYLKFKILLVLNSSTIEFQSSQISPKAKKQSERKVEAQIRLKRGLYS